MQIIFFTTSIIFGPIIGFFITFYDYYNQKALKETIFLFGNESSDFIVTMIIILLVLFSYACFIGICYYKKVFERENYFSLTLFIVNGILFSIVVSLVLSWGEEWYPFVAILYLLPCAIVYIVTFFTTKVLYERKIKFLMLAAAEKTGTFLVIYKTLTSPLMLLCFTLVIMVPLFSSVYSKIMFNKLYTIEQSLNSVSFGEVLSREAITSPNIDGGDDYYFGERYTISVKYPSYAYENNPNFTKWDANYLKGEFSRYFQVMPLTTFLPDLGILNTISIIKDNDLPVSVIRDNNDRDVIELFIGLPHKVEKRYSVKDRQMISCVTWIDWPLHYFNNTAKLPLQNSATVKLTESLILGEKIRKEVASKTYDFYLNENEMGRLTKTFNNPELYNCILDKNGDVEQALPWKSYPLL